jgi:hypothetical protein
MKASSQFFISDHGLEVLSNWPVFPSFLSGETSAEIFLENLKAFEPEIKKINSEMPKERKWVRIDADFNFLKQLAMNIQNRTEDPHMQFLRISKPTKIWWQSLFRYNEYITEDPSQTDKYKSPPPNLWYGGNKLTIRFTRDHGITDAVYFQAMEGIKDIVTKLNLDITFEDYDRDKFSLEQIQKALLDNSDVVHQEKLRESHANEPFRDTRKGGKLHADVVVTSRKIYSSEANKGKGVMAWGITEFMYGSCLLSPLSLPDLIYTRRLAAHEACHLLGLLTHHTPIEEEFKSKFGYAVDGHCLMDILLQNEKICERCFDALLYFWKGMEERHGMRFFKRRFF